MPAWAAQQRDDEVWALVAFLRRLPALDAHGYRDLALGDLQIAPQSGREVATSETASAPSAPARAATAPSETRRTSALVPILHGQPVEFLAAALAGLRERPPRQRHHAAGRERSRAARRSDRVARYYAGLRPPSGRCDLLPDATAAIERGRALAEQGDAGREDSGLHRMSRRGRAEDLSAPRRAERRLHGQPAAALEGRPRARHRHRSHHGADRARAERPADRRCLRPTSPPLGAAATARDEAPHPSRSALLLAGAAMQSCARTDQAGQIATLAWLLFALGAVVLAARHRRAVARDPRIAARCARCSRENGPSSRSGSIFPAVTLTLLLGYGVWLMRASATPPTTRRAPHRGHRRAMVVARRV